MMLNFTLEETCVLYGLLADETSDIILKTDPEGFILHASPAFERLGWSLPDQLIGPHVADLAQGEGAEVIRRALAEVMGGRMHREWIEFAAAPPVGGGPRFAMRMRGLRDKSGQTYGVLVVLRCVEDLRALEERLFITEMTDPLTGLTNRKAFVSMLEHLTAKEACGSLALFAIDHFRAINMNHGQATGDKALCAFAEFLTTLMPPEAIPSRIGSETFAVLLPRIDAKRAGALCREVIGVLAEVAATSSQDCVRITASAGLGSIAGGLDATLRRAELALSKARARGPSGFASEAEQAVPALRHRA